MEDKHAFHRDLIPELDPTVEGGPADAEPGPQECEAPVATGPGVDKVGESEVSPLEELQEQYQPQDDPVVMGADGIPEHVDPNMGQLPVAPDMRYDNFVCEADRRTWVSLFDTECPRSLDEHFRRTARSIVDFEQFDKRGKERERLRFDSSRVEEIFNHSVVFLNDKEIRDLGMNRSIAHTINGDVAADMVVFVRPIRPRCQHYKRQVFINDDKPGETDAGHFLVFRNCTHPARRTVGGASLGLRDEAIYACDYRDPFDAESVQKHLDDQDRIRFERGEAKRLPVAPIDLFGVKQPPHGSDEPFYVPPEIMEAANK